MWLPDGKCDITYLFYAFSAAKRKIFQVVDKFPMQPFLAIQSSLPAQEDAIGTSLVIFCQYFGGAVFNSVAETILINSLAASLPTLAPQVDAQTLIAAGVASVRTTVIETELPGVILAYNQALSHVFVSILSFRLKCKIH